MSGTLDRTAALRLGARMLRRHSQELQARGQFTEAEFHHEAAVELDGIRYDLDAGLQEFEIQGSNDRGGMLAPLDAQGEGKG